MQVLGCPPRVRSHDSLCPAILSSQIHCFSPGTVLLPERVLWCSQLGDATGHSGQRAGLPPTILLGTGQPPERRIIWSQRTRTPPKPYVLTQWYLILSTYGSYLDFFYKCQLLGSLLGNDVSISGVRPWFCIWMCLVTPTWVLS